MFEVIQDAIEYPNSELLITDIKRRFFSRDALLDDGEPEFNVFFTSIRDFIVMAWRSRTENGTPVMETSAVIVKNNRVVARYGTGFKPFLIR